jgi:hypothetical protein
MRSDPRHRGSQGVMTCDLRTAFRGAAVSCWSGIFRASAEGTESISRGSQKIRALEKFPKSRRRASAAVSCAKSTAERGASESNEEFGNFYEAHKKFEPLSLVLRNAAHVERVIKICLLAAVFEGLVFGSCDMRHGAGQLDGQALLKTGLAAG